MRDDATQAQVDAAAPDHSTWLAANAGSGKTRVLTDRVARLLLEGVDPSHILCLTYTKAAATEMQNRLFKRLGAWAMLDEAGLRDELDTLGVEDAPSHDFLQEARTLFARAIETPGGLRIQTIHSFCAALLRRFPLEAGVSPQFQEMEERAGELLRAEVIDRMSGGPRRALVQGIAPHLADDTVDTLLRALVDRKDAFLDPPSDAAIRAAYGLTPEITADALLDRVFPGGEDALAAALVPVLQAGGKTDNDLADLLKGIGARDLPGWKAALLTNTGTLKKRLGTKGVRTAAPDLFDRLDQLGARLEEALETERALEASARDIALTRFAGPFVRAYEDEKQARGWLDFDDLITRARRLLSDPQVADWVLYRLDGGIDHILVDEAQDTSPVQWQVIERLAHEFTSGEGARSDVRRTLFVVGDKKQSIYSFQGADPREFDRMREDFRARLAATDAPLVNAELAYSFRSAAPVLRVVDNTFVNAAESGFDGADHIAFKEALPGRVDLWPVVEKTADDEDGAWYEPLDRRGARHHTVILAERIARFIRQTIDARTPLPDGKTARPVHAGDFLILVRSRNRLFKEIIRACKQEALPIAGADRLKVMAELAVRDVIALLQFLETPDDSLSLATALRSPLFGMDEQTLFDLAHRRTRKHLWEELRERRDAFPEVMAVLDDLRGQTDFLRPYDLITRILTRHQGRQKLIGRLGPEAEDGLGALTQQALAYEQTAVPTLTGFLEWAQADNLEIKRAPDSAGETLRVMTVHGSKGLEAPIVILPDCAAPDGKLKAALLRDPDGVMWKQTSAAQPARQVAAVEAAKLREAQERDRLLYVALTRAEQWLVVAAAGDIGKDGAAWHEKVRVGLERAGPVDHRLDLGDLGPLDIARHEAGTWDGLHLHDAPERDAPGVTLPAHFNQPAQTPEPVAKTRAPSDLGGAKALPGAAGDTEEVAKARGTALHTLLEHLSPLPEDLRAATAPLLLGEVTDDDGDQVLLSAAQAEGIVSEALKVLGTPALSRFFAPDTLAEVSVTAELAGVGRIHGTIDRLVVTPEVVTAVDFKSNRTVPERADQMPEGVLRQLGAYAQALEQIYPGRRIETGVIWTATADYMSVPHDLVTQALRRAGI